MSLFLKNLPRSFYRAIVSSRPVFNKATSLFWPIASNAQSKLPAFPIARSHHVKTFSLSGEEKRRQILKKYCLYDRWYSTEKQKAKSSKSKSGHVQSGAVTCTVNKGVIECEIDCGKLGKGDNAVKKCQSKEEKKGKSAEKKCPVKEEKKPCASKEEKKHCPLKEEKKMVCDTSEKKIVAKFKKEEDPRVLDVQAISGTWVSKKCKKFEFSCCNLKDDDESRPYRLEDGKSAPKSKKTSSKALARKKCEENQKKKKGSSKTSKKKDCKTAEKKKECKTPEKKKECKTAEKKKECKTTEKKKECKTPEKKKECKKTGKKEKPGQQIKPDQSPINECIALCKKASKEKTKEKKEEKSSAVCKDKASKTNVADASKSKECTKTCKSKPPTKKTKSKSPKKVVKSVKKKEDAPCKPCTSKKEDKPKKRKSSSKKSPKKKEIKSKEKSDSCAEGKTKMANSSLVVSTYDTVACEDKKTAEMIKRLRKELEECKKAKSSGSKSSCVESPKLTSQLPKSKPQEKDVVAGSKSFIKNVCDGIFDKNKKTPAKKQKDTPGSSKSTPTVKSPKCPTPVRASKSADCKVKKPKEEKKDPCKKKEEKKDACAKKEEKKDKDPCEKKEEKKDVCAKKEEKKEMEPCKKKEEKKEMDPCKKKEEKKDVCPKKEEKIDLCKKKETKKVPSKEKVDPCKSLAKDKPKTSVCPPKKKKKANVCTSKKKKTQMKKKAASKKKTSKPKKIKCETKKAKSDSCAIPVAAKPVRRTKSDSLKPGKEEPPDQSPLMQCIALCRKKKKADRPLKGKGIPPRDKKACSNNIETYKKLVEFSEKKSKKQAKEEIKPFIPCMYEEIKPGIRGMDEVKCQEKKEEKADKEHCN